MGYQIEISCGLQIPSFQKSAIIAKATQWGCELHYSQYELEGRRRQIYHQKCIMTFVFPDSDFQKYKTEHLKAEIAHPFVRYIKARRGIYIECISTDSGSFEILYASPRYQAIMDKAQAKDYRKKIKHQSKD